MAATNKFSMPLRLPLNSQQILGNLLLTYLIVILIVSILCLFHRVIIETLSNILSPVDHSSIPIKGRGITGLIKLISELFQEVEANFIIFIH